jgi:hypothetical protein
MHNVTFWKFVSHAISTTHEDAAAIAKKIERRELVPIASIGERYYKLGGYCYDIGRKPYLIQYAHGSIARAWALSVSDLRLGLGLSRKDKVALDPFAMQANKIALAA